jgi:hypothetical protein
MEANKMKKYIGVKLIKSESMTHGDYAKEKYGENQIVTDFSKENKDKAGYKVVYQDGYVSWSPKEVFEKAYSTCGCEGCVSIRFDLKSGNWEFLPIEETSQKEIV